MLDRFLGWLKKRGREPAFEAIQVEVTTRCLTRCAMCPRTALADQWPEMDLAWETFQRIARAFPLSRHVHLQGWGEPLLHPRLFDMIALAKQAGCRVGLTTNGMGLDQVVAGRLLETHLDLLAISIAGATSCTHESIRIGSDFSLILENVCRLLALRGSQGERRPKVEFSYLMTRTNLSELPDAVDLTASLGADELYATNLDYPVTPDHESLKAFANPHLQGTFSRSLDEARGRASRAGLGFRSYPLDLEEVAMCEAHPTRMLFIGSDGWVSPCPYMGLAGRSDIPRAFEGQSLSVPRLRFGSVVDQDLVEIWKSPPYRAFRRQFERRLAEARAQVVGVETCSGNGYQPGSIPPPDVCLTCYKLYGV